MAIQSCEGKKRDAVKIDYSSDKDCEIYSITLIDQMSSLGKRVDNTTTNKLYGRTYGNSEIIEFDIF